MSSGDAANGSLLPPFLQSKTIRTVQERGYLSTTPCPYYRPLFLILLYPLLFPADLLFTLLPFLSLTDLTFYHIRFKPVWRKPYPTRPPTFGFEPRPGGEISEPGPVVRKFRRALVHCRKHPGTE